MTPLQAMLKNLAVIIRKADAKVGGADRRPQPPCRSQDAARDRVKCRTLLPSALVHRDQPELDPEAEAIVA